MSEHRFVAGEEEAGLRLDVALVKRVPEMSRSKARALIAEGAVRVDGRRAKKSSRLSPGSEVSLSRLPDPSDFDPEPGEAGRLVVLYEDAALVVVDKPAGVPTHPLVPEDEGTLAQDLLAAYPEMRGVGYRQREPGILHRLDNDTSGALLAARDAETFAALRAALRAGAMEKRYLALVRGEPEVSRIAMPLGPDPKDRRRVQAYEERIAGLGRGAREAKTNLLRKRRAGAEFYLIELEVATARRHQIRAHMAAIGHPLVGDLLYGGPELPGLDRHFLHASYLAFDHPKSGERVEVSCPLPAELESALEGL